jgi:biotin carboxyl carrier protein
MGMSIVVLHFTFSAAVTDSAKVPPTAPQQAKVKHQVVPAAAPQQGATQQQVAPAPQQNAPKQQVAPAAAPAQPQAEKAQPEKKGVEKMMTGTLARIDVAKSQIVIKLRGKEYAMTLFNSTEIAGPENQKITFSDLTAGNSISVKYILYSPDNRHAVRIINNSFKPAVQSKPPQPAAAEKKPMAAESAKPAAKAEVQQPTPKAEEKPAEQKTTTK